MRKYVESATISFDFAHQIVREVIDEAALRGVRAVVTIADPSLVSVAFGKADGATPHSVETSRRKAFTAASTRKATGWMDAAFAIEAPLATNTILTNIRGGAPLTLDGLHVGGLGVAGGTPAQDEEIAIAVIERLGLAS